jgi:iron complex transport system substrate-binding protein
LSLGDRVVGVGSYTTWPAEAAALPELGGFFDANLERIVALRPDLAVLTASERDLGAKLRGLGIETLEVRVETLAEVERSFHSIAERCGVPEAGRALAARWREGLAPRRSDQPAKRRSDQPAERRSDQLGAPRVLVSVGRSPGKLSQLYVAGPKTFFGELVARLGAVNVFADAPTLYPQVGPEEVLARRPDVVLELRTEPAPPAVAAALRRDWEEMAGLAGGRPPRVVVIAEDYAVIPGPRLPLLYRRMAAALAVGKAPAKKEKLR